MIARNGAPLEQLQPPIDRVVAFINPACSGKASLQEKLAQVEDATGKIVEQVVSTSLAELTAARLYQAADKLGEGTLGVVLGGDGWANTVVRELYGNPAISDDVRKSPVLFTASGRANDIARGLHCDWDLRNLGRIINSKHRRPIAIQPIKITGAYENGAHMQTTAVGYWGVGASAAGAKALNAAKPSLNSLRRTPRLAAEIGMVMREFLHQEPFDLWQEEAQSPKCAHNVIGFTIANGPRMAEQGRWQTSFESPEACLSIVRSGRSGLGRLPLALEIGARLKFGMMSVETVDLSAPNTSMQYTILPRDNKQIFMQFDGETAPAPHSFQVSAAPAFMALTTNRPTKNLPA